MATIIKRKKNYSVVYYYDTPQGEKKQKWETFTTYKDANKRKVEIESQQENGTFIAPTSQTVEDFLYDFVTLYIAFDRVHNPLKQGAPVEIQAYDLVVFLYRIV